MGDGFQHLGLDAPFFSFFQHFSRTEPGHAAVIMPNHEYLCCAQLIHGYQDAAHNAPEGMGDDGAGAFDDFGVAVAQIHGFGQKLHQTGIHAGQNDDFFVRKFVGDIFLVLPFLHKGLIIVQDVRDTRHVEASQLHNYT
ncbi:hypothetical protein D3C75_842170 [compost metagenome]